MVGSTCLDFWKSIELGSADGQGGTRTALRAYHLTTPTGLDAFSGKETEY